MSSVSGSVALPAVPLAHILAAGTGIIRIHRTANGPIWFGPGPGRMPGSRFDAAAGEFGVLYGAEHLEGAFVETVLKRVPRIVARGLVDDRQWSVLHCLRDLRLLKLFDEGLQRHGVSADIGAGDDYGRPQAFSSAVFAAYPDIDGVAYRARHDNGQLCYALFDRIGTGALGIGADGRFDADRALADMLMRRYGASWDPMSPLPDP